MMGIFIGLLFFIVVIFVLILVIVHLSKENESQDLEILKLKNEKIYMDSIIESYSKGQKENEELIRKASSGNSPDSFDASIQLVHEQSEKGKRRNNN